MVLLSATNEEGLVWWLLRMIWWPIGGVLGIVCRMVYMVTYYASVVLWKALYYILPLAAFLILPPFLLFSILFHAFLNSAYFPSPKKSKESVVFITGCDTGFGNLTAKQLSSDGFHVVAAVLKQESMQELESFGNSQKGLITPLLLNVTDEQAIVNAAQKVKEIISNGNKKLVAVVNNAGIAVYGPLEAIPIEKVQLQMDVNFHGHISVAQKFIPLLRESKGRLVNIVSIASRVAAGCMAPYAASKFGMRAATTVMRQELAPFGISVSSIEPGFMKTKMVQGAAEGFSRTWESLEGAVIGDYEHLKRSCQLSSELSYKHSGDPTTVVHAISHAICSSSPRSSYQVGNDAKFFYYLESILPESWYDVITLEILPKLF